MVSISIKYSVCDLSSDVITCVWSCDRCKIIASDTIMFYKQKKRENVEIKDILNINLHLEDRLDIEFTAC